MPATTPCAGGVTMVKVSASWSGSDPLNAIGAAVSASIVSEAAFATGARFVWVTDQVKVAAADSEPSLTRTVMEFDPAAPKATVPLITPLLGLMAKPAGRPVAV